MARLFTSGFEKNSQTVNHEFTAINDAGVGCNIVTTNVRTGTYAGAITPLTSGQASGWLYELKSAAVTGPLFAKMAFRYTTTPTIASVIMALSNAITFATIQAADPTVKFSPTGTLQLFNGAAQIGSDSQVLEVGRWYEIEMYWDNTPAANSKILKARLNQVEFASSVTISALNTNNRSILVGGNLFFEANAVGSWMIDDIAVNDATGTAQTTYVGSEKVLMLKPSAAGDANTFATQTGGTAGAANNFTRVNEVTPNDATTFNGASVLSQTDMFNMDDSGIGTSDIVNVVHVDFRFRNNTADATAAIRTQIEKAAAGTIAQSASIIPNSTTFKTNATAVPNVAPQILYLDPDGAAWTKTTLDSMQVGYKLQTAGTNRVDVSQIVAMVGYTPRASLVFPNRLSRNTLIRM